MSSQKSTRRNVLRGLASATIGGVAAHGQTPAGRQRIPMEYTPNLDQDLVYAFLFDQSRTSYDEPPIARANYHEWDTNQRKLVGDIKLPPTGDTPHLFWAVRENYELTQNGQVTGHFDIEVVNEQAVAVTVNRTLLMKNGIDPTVAGKIQNFYLTFDPLKDGDPIDYAKSKMAADPSITADAFSVEYVFALSKTGSVIPHDDKKKAALGLFDGSSRAQVYDEKRQTHPLGERLQQEKVGYKLLTTILIGRIPSDQTPSDPVREVRGSNANAPTIIDNIIAAETEPLKCDMGFHKKEWPLLTLLVWPEFKIAWKDVDINIGCGIHIVLRLPWLYIRTSHLDLWVYLRVPDNVAASLDTVITTCLRDSALSPPVLAVALFNFPAALGIFIGLFSDCISKHVFEQFACMIPGLALISAVNPPDWP